MQTFIGIQCVTKGAVNASIGGEDFNLDSIAVLGGQKKNFDSISTETNKVKSR